MYPRTEYEMTEEDLATLQAAFKPVPYMIIGGQPPASQQENANRAWEALGKKMGFDFMTVRPFEGKGPRSFMAVPSETEEAKAERVAAVERERDIAEIGQLETEIAAKEARLHALKSKIIIIIAAVLLASTAHAQTYGPYPEQTYTTCGNPAATTAVELVHGGGDYWGDYTTAPNPQICSYLAANGFYVMSTNYRLATVAGQEYPTQGQDVQMGIRYLRSQGFKRVVVVGWSAGGLNALIAELATGTIINPATDPLDEAHVDSHVSSLPDATVTISAVTDLSSGVPAAMEPALTRGMASSMSWAVQAATASPVTYVRAGNPPLLMFHGINDPIVAPIQMTEFVDAIRAIGGTAKPVWTNGGHVFLGLTPTEQNVVLRQVAACVAGASLCVPRASQP